MRYHIVQKVKVVDMNEEIMFESTFDHGQIDSAALSVGCSVLTYELGLKQFEVVHDKREGRTVRYKIVDIEIDLIHNPGAIHVYLEPVKLIIGQHDVGEV